MAPVGPSAVFSQKEQKEAQIGLHSFSKTLTFYLIWNFDSPNNIKGGLIFFAVLQMQELRASEAHTV